MSEIKIKYRYPVLHTSHNLSLLPPCVITKIAPSYWRLQKEEWLRSITHLSITSITHAFSYTNNNSYYHLCSILLEGVPAFMYVVLDNIYIDVFIIDMDVTKAFILLLVELDLEQYILECTNSTGANKATVLDLYTEGSTLLTEYQGMRLEFVVTVDPSTVTDELEYGPRIYKGPPH